MSDSLRIMNSTVFKKIIKSLSPVLLAAALMLSMMLQSCSKPPELESIRAELEALVRNSAEVNDIFFGEGLEVYPRESSGDGNALYDENSGIYYNIITEKDGREIFKYYDSSAKKYVYAEEYGEPQKDSAPNGISFTDEGLIAFRPVVNGSADTTFYYKVLEDYKEEVREYVYDEDSPLLYDYVRLESKYQSVDQIKELAEKVYSKEYLESIYVIMFDGLKTDDQLIYARYMTDESGNTDFFLKSNVFKPYFETQTKYDLSEMKLVNPSRANYINVEVTAYGTYIDYETLEKKTGNYKKVLKFVLESDGWKLDTPTY